MAMARYLPGPNAIGNRPRTPPCRKMPAAGAARYGFIVAGAIVTVRSSERSVASFATATR